MDNYISESSPFRAGKKKEEFPDAFSLEMIRVWQSNKNISNNKVYLLSDDLDWQNYADDKEDYTIVKSINSFIDKVNKDSYRDIYLKIEALILKNEEWLNTCISEEIDLLYKSHYIYTKDTSLSEFFLVEVNEEEYKITLNYHADVSMYIEDMEYLTEYNIVECYLQISCGENYSSIEKIEEVELIDSSSLESHVEYSLEVYGIN
ncbi:hypothetical protein QIW49_02780 [Francisellaceae bacterium CB300]